MASNDLSERARSGFAKAAFYDQHRPSYPPQAVTALLNHAGVLGLSGARIVDLAAGTGKFTESLSAREEKFDIWAVEPHKEMREQLDQKALAGVSVHDGLSTKIPAEDQSVDALFAAQAFHWFANLDSLKEIHRVLKPGGVFGVIWNAEDYNQTREATPSTKWEAKLKDLTWSLDDVLQDHEPRYRHNKWRDVFDNQIKSTPLTITTSANPLFSLPLGEDKVDWTVWLDKESLWRRYSTLSQVATQQEDQLAKTRQAFDDALRSDDIELNEKGEIAVHGTTIFAWTSKVPA